MRDISHSKYRPVSSILDFARDPELVACVRNILFLAAGVAGLGISLRLASAVVGGSADDINKLVLSLAAVIGGPILIWRALIAAEQTRIARESHYTSLFTKAIEQLGATKEVRGNKGLSEDIVSWTEPNLEVRLGAIYALERIALESKRDYWPIIETLCAYIRENSTPPGEVKKSPKEDPFANIPELRVDLQAAISVIGRRPLERLQYEFSQAIMAGREYDGFRLDFRRANLQRADLSYGSFARAMFDGAHLEGAKIWRTRFDKSSFFGTKFAAMAINFSSFENCTFVEATFEDTAVIKSSAVNSSFEHIRAEFLQFLMTDVSHSNFSNSTVRIVAANSDFSECSFDKITMPNSSFTHCAFTSATFNGACLGYRGLQGTKFVAPSGLTQAQLDSTDMRNPEMPLPEGLTAPTRWNVSPLGYRLNL